MANIRLDLNHAPLDGESVTFKAPCNASEITGLIIYYQDAGKTVSKSFMLCDANGGDIGEIDNIFSVGSIVKILLDTDENKAFMQNPDTNTYIEGRFGNKAQKKHTHSKSEITDFPSSMPASDVPAWAKAANKPSYTASEVDASPTGHKHTKSEITDFPTSMPASDVPSWAKAVNKPSYTASEVGASPTGHKHTKSEITDFPTSMTPTAHTHKKSDISDFPTSMTPTAHNHAAGDINSGTFSSDRLPTVPLTKGGTGATTAANARTNLGIKSETWTFTLEDGSTVSKVVYIG